MMINIHPRTHHSVSLVTITLCRFSPSLDLSSMRQQTQSDCTLTHNVQVLNGEINSNTFIPPMWGWRTSPSHRVTINLWRGDETGTLHGSAVGIFPEFSPVLEFQRPLKRASRPVKSITKSETTRISWFSLNWSGFYVSKPGKLPQFRLEFTFVCRWLDVIFKTRKNLLWVKEKPERKTPEFLEFPGAYPQK